MVHRWVEHEGGNFLGVTRGRETAMKLAWSQTYDRDFVTWRSTKEKWNDDDEVLHLTYSDCHIVVRKVVLQ